MEGLGFIMNLDVFRGSGASLGHDRVSSNLVLQMRWQHSPRDGHGEQRPAIEAIPLRVTFRVTLRSRRSRGALARELQEQRRAAPG